MNIESIATIATPDWTRTHLKRFVEKARAAMPNVDIYLIMVCDRDPWMPSWASEFKAIKFVKRDDTAPGLAQFDALRFMVCEWFGLPNCLYIDADVDVVKPFDSAFIPRGVPMAYCRNPAPDQERPANNGMLWITSDLSGAACALEMDRLCRALVAKRGDYRNVGLDAFNAFIFSGMVKSATLPDEWGTIWQQGIDASTVAVHWCSARGHEERMMQGPRRVTILGGGMSAHERRTDIEKYCTEEIIVMNDGYLGWEHLKGQVSRIYEMHGWDYLRNEFKPRAGGGVELDHFDQLRAFGAHVWAGGTLPIIPIDRQSVVPFEEMVRTFKTRYFCGSPSLILWHLLYEHAKGRRLAEVRVWGIDTLDAQHVEQRPSWAYWTGIARSMGIDITGSGLVYQSAPDNDAGLAWLHAKIGDCRLGTLDRKDGAR